MARCTRAAFLIKTSTFWWGKGEGICRIEKLEVNWKYYVRVCNEEEEMRGGKKRNANRSYFRTFFP